MTTKPKTENQVAEEAKKPEKKFDTSAYHCQVILEKTTIDKAQDRSLPTDAFNVYYTVDGKEHLDVTRSEKMVNVFDLYYDRYGKGAVQKISYGGGTIRPILWGVKAPEKNKRRKP